MTAADRHALRRLLGGGASPRATTDDLQGLLLQVVFALLMVFIIAYFVFVERQRKERDEAVMDVRRQKLELALDKETDDRLARYGINALMTQGTDGRRTFDADPFVRGGELDLAPAAKRAFADGSRAALADYADRDALAGAWRTNVLSAAGLADGDLSADLSGWLDSRIRSKGEELRLDVRGAQRALAARLQRRWVEHPEALDDVREPAALAAALRRRSLEKVAEATGASLLP